MMADIEWENYIRKRARESVISQAIDQVLERYHYKRGLLRAMPKGATCSGCPYWDNVNVKCIAEACDAERKEPDWKELDKEEKRAIENVRSYLEQLFRANR
jgi:hypothetical protein